MEWKENNKRFVLFFDILGFKDMVMKDSHKNILNKLKTLKSKANELERFEWSENQKEMTDNVNIEFNQTRSVTFSDSIIFFSNGDTIADFLKILIDAYSIQKIALENNIAIKGAISYGELTVDFKNSLFFGQPLIDAYLLHEELHVLGIILDHNAESKSKLFYENESIKNSLNFQKVKMKFGMASHTMFGAGDINIIDKNIEKFKNLYKTTSGKHRLYIDNTIDYYNEFKESLYNKASI